jgi:hypothetical protein
MLIAYVLKVLTPTVDITSSLAAHKPKSLKLA